MIKISVSALGILTKNSLMRCDVCDTRLRASFEEGKWICRKCNRIFDKDDIVVKNPYNKNKTIFDYEVK